MTYRLRHPRWSNLPDLEHGFYTRQGGVSEGVYRGLNGGLGSRDDSERVRRNWSMVARDMRLEDATRLLGVKQVHGTTVTVLDCEQALYDVASRPEADGLVTNLRGVGVAILTADCVPVLFADYRAGVVGVAHAGWKGALCGVLEATVRAMEALGARDERIEAVVGPSIAQSSYQVSAEYRARFIVDDSDNARYFVPSPADGNDSPVCYQFDLPGYIEGRLHSGSLASVHCLSHDTYADEDNFFSFRRSVHRSEADYGRQISCIALPRQ